MKDATQIGDEVNRWFEATDFSEDVKVLAGPLMRRLNRLMRKHMAECKARRVPKADCTNAQLLAAATVLKMHQEFANERKA